MLRLKRHKCAENGSLYELLCNWISISLALLRFDNHRRYMNKTNYVRLCSSFALVAQWKERARPKGGVGSSILSKGTLVMSFEKTTTFSSRR